MERQEFLHLAEKISKGTAADADIARYNAWYNTFGQAESWNEQQLGGRDVKETQLLAAIRSRIASLSPSKIRRLHPRRIAAAAIVGIALSFAAYYFVNHTNLNSKIVNLKSNDIDPGGNRAILTLADGRKIVLDEAANGELAEESGIKITKTEDGQVVYEILRHAPQARASDKRQPKAGSADWRMSVRRDPATYNTIETPKGGQYKIILPDSSVVWLNAASSLRYPTRFIGEERRVELTGEAFFSVRQLVRPLADQTSDTRHQTVSKQADAGKVPTTNIQPFTGARSLSDYWRMSRVPFIVATATQEVTVLGTQFNISAYTDEAAVKTTLLEGSVAVSLSPAGEPVPSLREGREGQSGGRGRYEMILVPNEQSILQGTDLRKQAVDVEESTAWKDGLFIFRNTDLKTIMLNLSRWYDVSIDTGNLPDKKFNGRISRSVPLSKVLEMMEKSSDLKFRIETVPGKSGQKSAQRAERRIEVMK